MTTNVSGVIFRRDISDTFDLDDIDVIIYTIIGKGDIIYEY